MTQPTQRQPRRTRRMLIGLMVVAAAVGLVSLGLLQGRASTPAPATVAVTRGAVVASVAGSGTLTAAQSVTLPFQTSGVVAEVLVREGATVQPGQVLVRLDSRSLQAQVANATAALESARAQLAQAIEGDATAEEIAAAEASVANAAAQLERARTGNVTAADLADAEAAVRSAEARLRSTVAGATTEQDVADAEAALRAAEAKLADVRAGARAEDVEIASQKLAQARDSRSKQASQLSNAKEQARLAMEQAASGLRSAQSKYGASKLIWEEAQRTGKDPNIPEQAGQPKGYRDLTDSKRRQYKADFEAAEQTLRQAEQTLEQRQLAYEDARKQEIVGLQQAESQVAEAQANLDKLRAGAAQTEIDQAQAAVDQARARLEKLRRPVDANDVAQAQAALDQARANLAKRRAGGTAADIAAAQATLDQARANREKLTAPTTSSAIRIRQAAVSQAEAALEQARLGLDQATLRAPFAGVVTDVAVVPGSIVGVTSPIISLIDRTSLHVELTLSENDVARVALGQPVALTIDAVSDWRATGEVATIAPAAEVKNNVVTYGVQVRFVDRDPRVKVGMTANVAITVGRQEGVLLVPNGALLPKGAGRVVQLPWASGQPPIEREVQTGLTDGALTEIVAGLTEDERILAAPSLITSAPSGLFGNMGRR